MALSKQGREAQAECLRQFLGAAEGYSAQAVEETAQAVLRGDVEFDPEWLESLAPPAGSRAEAFFGTPAREAEPQAEAEP
jgi:hypothetical protein